MQKARLESGMTAEISPNRHCRYIVPVERVQFKFSTLGLRLHGYTAMGSPTGLEITNLEKLEVLSVI